MVECLHTCSLMVDDIIDGTSVRRGRPSAHQVYGIPLTLGCSYTALFHALLSSAVHLGDSALLIITEEAARMHHANTTEVYWREQRQPPSLRRYMAMVEGKTGSGFRVVTRLLMSGMDMQPVFAEHLTLFTELAGHFFQIRDDYLDVISERYCEKKGGVGSDIREGNWSHPIICASQICPETAQYFQDLFALPGSQRAQSVPGAIQRLIATGALDMTLSTLQQLVEDLERELLHLKEAGDTGMLLDWLTRLREEIPEANKS
eukprot:NODE_2231_length_1257_cov_30.302980_g2032_i0.p1 GENE.NODE_2231_length_1257_cov_30.302980_g2032_i0~~NODE_2231_length_1257_cov_30.302980_g2032_i0.p1  ORF type:complete len:261 (+),score=43.18 NODE_2231_length_1257_cov_30.302980_g2032_i0:445-1227(+)